MTVNLEEYYEITIYDSEGAQVGKVERYEPTYDITPRIEAVLDFNPTYSVKAAVVRKDVMVFKSTAFGVTLSE